MAKKSFWSFLNRKNDTKKNKSTDNTENNDNIENSENLSDIDLEYDNSQTDLSGLNDSLKVEESTINDSDGNDLINSFNSEIEQTSFSENYSDNSLDSLLSTNKNDSGNTAESISVPSYSVEQSKEYASEEFQSNDKNKNDFKQNTLGNNSAEDKISAFGNDSSLDNNKLSINSAEDKFNAFGNDSSLDNNKLSINSAEDKINAFGNDSSLDKNKISENINAPTNNSNLSTDKTLDNQIKSNTLSESSKYLNNTSSEKINNENSNTSTEEVHNVSEINNINHFAYKNDDSKQHNEILKINNNKNTQLSIGKENTIVALKNLKASSVKEDKVNKFDLVCIKIWSSIVSVILAFGIVINNGINAIFKKRAPQKYVNAFLIFVIIILILCILISPFKSNVKKVENSVDLYSDNLIGVKSKVVNPTTGNFEYKWGYADRKGKIVIDCKYEEVTPFNHSASFVLRKEILENGGEYKYWQIINKKGKLLSDKRFTYDTTLQKERPVGEFTKDSKLAWVKIAGKYGFINNKGKLEIEPLYEYAESFSSGFARVRQGYVEFFIDENGKIKGNTYEEVASFQDNMAAVKNNGKWGFVSTKHKEIISTSYDAVSNFVDGLAMVRVGSTYGIINAKGKLIIKTLEFNQLAVYGTFGIMHGDE